jgi:hypothetical protein
LTVKATMANLLWSLESSGILQMNPDPAWIFALLSRSNKTARRRGRLPWVGLSNSGFGTVFGVVDGKPQPVCDYAGFAPFGFGYRRCPGEQLTIQVFEDFLRKVWRDKIVFRKLNLANPGRVPIGPNAVIEDNIGFARPA